MTLAPAVTASNLVPDTASPDSLPVCSLTTNFSPSPAAATTTDNAPTAAVAQGSSALAVPKHHSDVSAKAKLFLDFDGHNEAKWSDRKNIHTPAFNLDDNPTSFTSAERAAIDEIWARVAEDFAPFNIDVTTVDPGSYQHGVVAVIAIGGDDSDWYHQSAGGVALVDGFSGGGSGSNVGFVFPLALNGSSQEIADAASHEAGHLFGLLHQSLWNGNSLVDAYSPGNNYSAPIMGVSYYADRSTWSNGTPESSPNAIQDDMAVIAGPQNGFGFRNDDYPDTFQTAAPLPVNGTNVNLSGLVGRSNDQDVWKFSATAGNVSFALTGAQYGSNLDGELDLWNSDGSVIASNNSAFSLNAQISATVDAGTYYLVAHGAGDYGDVGRYTISGTIPASQGPDIEVSVDGVALSDFGIVDFGHPTPGQQVDRTVTITNRGTATLTLTSVDMGTVGSYVKLLSNLGKTSLAPGESTSFTLQFDATQEVYFIDFIRIGSNDSDESPFPIELTGRVDLPKPGVNVSVDGTNFIDDNNNYFGFTAQGVPITKKFTITNGGTTSLNFSLLNPSLPTGFTLISNLESTALDPGESTDFTVRLDAASEGTFLAKNIYLMNGDSSAILFHLRFSGDVGQTIDVTLDGMTSVGDGGTINFGRVAQGSSSVRTIMVMNRGTSALSLVPLTAADMPSGFTLVSNIAPTSLSTGQTTIFVVRLDATTIGDFSGSIHIVNSDSDNNPYDLKLTGTVGLPSGPDIDVSFYGQSIADGGTLNLADIIPGNPVYANITVTNQGTTILHMAMLKDVKLPSGFTLISDIDNNWLHPGESTLFTIKIYRTEPGPISGTIQLKSDDPDESVYDLTISGNVPQPNYQLVDNGDAANTYVGKWKKYTGNGYYHDLHYAPKGDGNTSSQWTFSNLAPGQYQVEATWTGNRKNASNAPFTLLDGLETRSVVQVNQRVAPGIQTSSGRWMQLGIITVTSGQLVVQLTNAANGLVVADAVRIQRVNPANSQPTVINPPTASTAHNSTPAPPLTANVAASEPEELSPIQPIADAVTGLAVTALTNPKTDPLSNNPDSSDSDRSAA